MPETCLISNRTRGILVLNLPHGVVPEHATMGLVGTRIATVKSEKVEKGRKFIEMECRVHAHKRPISGSITLLGKGQDGSAVEVSRSAIHAPEVKAALKRGDIEIKDPPKAEATPASAPEAQAPEAKKPAKGVKE
jgi:hypothetical protein